MCRGISARAAALSLFTAVTLVIALTGQGSAQEPSPLTVSIVGVDDSAFPEIRVVFNALERGRPIPDLTAAEVTLTENGTPAPVSKLEQASASSVPLAVVIAIDVSGSMAGTLAEAKDAAIGLVESLAPGDSAALVAFADTATLQQPFTTDHSAITAAIGNLSAAGNTALYDGIAVSAELARTSGATRRVVVLLSDGADFGGRSTATRERSLTAASGASVFYAIGVGMEIDSAYLSELAARTGGNVYTAPSAAELSGVYESIGAIFRTQYALTYRSPLGADVNQRTIAVSAIRAGTTGEGAFTHSLSVSPTPPPATRTPLPAATAVPASTESPADGDGSIVPILFLVGGLAAVGLSGMAYLRARRGPTFEAQGEVLPLAFDSVAAPLAGATPTTTLHASGPGFETSFALGSEPVVLGDGPSVALQLPAAPGVAAEHVRLFLRDGTVMVHHLDRASVTLVDGQPIAWASLRPGQLMTIGPYTIAIAAG